MRLWSCLFDRTPVALFVGPSPSALEVVEVVQAMLLIPVSLSEEDVTAVTEGVKRQLSTNTLPNNPFLLHSEHSSFVKVYTVERAFTIKSIPEVCVISNLYDQKLIPLAKELRKNMTHQERRLWYEFLRQYSPPFQRQKVVDAFIVDFYCDKARLCIELDGDQYYTEEGLMYDAKRTKILSGYSLQVVRFPNNDINNNFAAVCVYIDNEVKKRQRFFVEDDKKRREEGIDLGL